MTDVRLLGWKAQGMRCPDHEISLTRPNGRPHHVSLIQMPNGTGKTTTLELLRAALSGPEAWSDPNIISEFAPHRTEAVAGSFVVRLQVDTRRFTIEMSLDFNSQKVEFRTTWISSVPRFKRPPPLLRVLTPEFVPFFVFNGELAHDLLDPRKTRAREALEVQFQLTSLNQFVKLMDQYWEDKARHSTTKGGKGLTQRRNRLAKLIDRHKRLLEEQQELTKKFHGQTASYEALSQDFKHKFDQDTQAQEERRRLETDLDRAEAKLSKFILTTFDDIRQPHYLSSRFTAGLQELRQNFEKLKLPENVAKEFFEDLADADHCVCGEEMTNARRESILNRRDAYLGKEDQGILNAIKGAIKDLAGSDPLTYREQFDKCLTRLGDAVRDRDLIKGELDALEHRRLAGGDDELNEIKIKRDALEQSIRSTKSRLAELNAEDDGGRGDETDSLKALNKLIARARDMVDEAAKTRDIRIKTDLLKEIIEAAVEDATTKIAEQLVQATNTRLEGILVRAPLRVADIKNSVVLDGQSRGSPGQTLALGYAFLLGLFDAGQVSLPFIVDSPTGALDKNVRREIAELLPGISQQLVAFTTSSEYERFIPELHRAAREDVQYITMFRLNDATRPLLKRVNSEKTLLTSNGVLVLSKSFFEDFDSEAYDEDESQRAAK